MICGHAGDRCNDRQLSPQQPGAGAPGLRAPRVHAQAAAVLLAHAGTGETACMDTAAVCRLLHCMSRFLDLPVLAADCLAFSCLQFILYIVLAVLCGTLTHDFVNKTGAAPHLFVSLSAHTEAVSSLCTSSLMTCVSSRPCMLLQVVPPGVQVPYTISGSGTLRLHSRVMRRSASQVRSE